MYAIGTSNTLLIYSQKMKSRYLVLGLLVTDLQGEKLTQLCKNYWWHNMAHIDQNGIKVL